MVTALSKMAGVYQVYLDHLSYFPRGIMLTVFKKNVTFV